MATKNEKWALGAIFAAIVGFITGILTAPKSGKETRKVIEGEVVEEKNKAEDELQKAVDELESLIEKAKDQAGIAGGKAKNEAASAIAQAKEAKDKTKKLLIAAKAGKADDSEVSAVLKDAAKTVKHLKQYYKS